MPKLEITGIEQMVLFDAWSKNRAMDLSGVNLLFLAPEYYGHEDFDWKVDIWSIGTILYLLITNGVNPTLPRRDYSEHFNFMEHIWNAVGDHVKEFMEMMIKKNPDERATMDELFQSDFIRRHENRMYENWIISNKLTVEPEPRLYRFYSAYLINEIILRRKRNLQK